MEVKETAACGISHREFAVEFDEEELPEIYRVLRYVKDGTGFYDEDFLEDLKSQMSYIIGPSLEDETQETEEESVRWEDTGTSYLLHFKEPDAPRLYQILNAVEHPGEGFDAELNDKLMGQMMEMAPSLLENLPVINR
ncbi:MAG: hypothetical protein JRJ29_06400 [Deltaproteobacteria bacterium]|nr:hypothetical protein [Deltaproteobacteria bacterium]